MPMDIRNFFAAAGKKKTTAGGGANSNKSNSSDEKKKKKKNDDAAASSKKNKAASSAAAATSKSQRKVAPAAAAESKAVTKKKESSKRSKKKRRDVIDDDDSDDEDYVVGSDVEDEDDDIEILPDPKKKKSSSSRHFNKSSSPTKKRKQNMTFEEELDEDDADDAMDLQQRNSKPATAAAKSDDVMDVDDEDDDDEIECFDAPKSKTKASTPASKKKDTKSKGVLMSPSDYFAKVARPSPAKKNKSNATASSPYEPDINIDQYPTDEDVRSGAAKNNKSASPAAAATADSIDLTGDDDADDDKKVTPELKREPSRSPTTTKERKKPPPPAAAASSPPASTRKNTKRARSSSTKKTKRDPPLSPGQPQDSFNTEKAVAECLQGYTFVFTGVGEDWSREAGQEFVKELGGRVTGAVSGVTDYLVVMGTTLEDGREYTEGSKYKKASVSGRTKIIMGQQALYGIAQQYHEKAGGNAALTESPASPGIVLPVDVASSPSTSVAVAKKAPVAPAAAAASAKPVNNPYAKSGQVTNPYAKVTTNPYAKATTNPYAKTTTNPYAKKTSSAMEDKKPAAIKSNSNDKQVNMLWVDKYKPQTSQDILANNDAVKKLAIWLARWEENFNHEAAVGKSFSNPKGPWKAALLSGPPGIGKTTTATVVATEDGRDLIEFNASDVRSKRALKDQLGDIIGSRTIEFGSRKQNRGRPTKRCIIMDEVDGMGAGDRSGMAELIQMIKHSRVPIICICNDRQAQKIKSLAPYCMDLRFRRPVKTTVATRAVAIALKEGLRVERNAAEAIAESCGNDVRQVLNCLQMWSSNNKDTDRMSYKDLKARERSINKDEMLRVSLFDAARLILEGRRGLSGGTDSKKELDSFFKRNDAFFVDYNFTGLLVQQNYLKVVQGSFNNAKRSGDQDQVYDALERMSKAADSMSDFTMAENKLRGDQNWSLLPFTGALAVKTGYHAGGELGGFVPGFPEFTTWLGRNSTKGKRARILAELQHHMNYKISGGTQEMRLAYLPVFRTRFHSLLSKGGSDDGNGTEQAIALMDEYGLDRDDVFESLDEFKMDPKADTFAKMDSKAKAAFTRAYNAGAHKSQALIAEQGGAPKKRRKTSGGAAVPGEAADPDAINEDNDDQEDDDDENDDEEDAKKIMAMFKKKGKRGGGGKGKGKAKAAPKKASSKSKVAKKRK